MAAPQDSTLVRNAIHNPSEPRHFMRVVAADRERLASVAGAVIARSADAVVVKEVGLDIYDPVVYFARADVDMNTLVRIEKSTHCPLKGDTEYFDIITDGDRIAEAAWSYIKMVAGDELLDLIAFDTSKITVT